MSKVSSVTISTDAMAGSNPVSEAPLGLVSKAIAPTLATDLPPLNGPEAVTLLPLPTDFPKTPASGFVAGYCPFVLPDAIATSRLGQASATPAASNIKTQSQLLAAFQALLYRYTQQATIQTQLVFAHAAGVQVPVMINESRSQMGGDLTVQMLIDRAAAMLHQATEVLVDQAHAQRSPLPVGLTFLHHVAPLEHTSQWLEALSPVWRQSIQQPDLHLVLSCTDTGIAGLWVYNANLFLPQTIQRLSGHFHTLLTGLVTDPAQAVAALPLLTPGEQYQLTVAWNENTVGYPQQPIYQVIEAHAQRYPDAIAITFRDQAWTYAELNQRANQLAHYLRACGVKAGDRVAVCIQPALEIGIALLGILKAGAVYVPLDPTHPADRLTVILEDTQAQVLLTQAHLRSHLPPTAHVFCLDHDWPTVQAFPTHNPDLPLDLAQTAYIIYTSGTTGKPKGVMASHRNLINYILATQDRLGFDRQDVMPAIARFTFSISLFELLSPLAAGGTLVVLEREHILDFAQLTKTMQQLTMLHTVPSLMQRLVHYIRETGLNPQLFSNLKHIFTGGDIVSVDLLEALKEIFQNAHLAVLYGCSEVSSLCATFPVSCAETLTKSRVGKPFNNVSIRLYDAHQNLVPIGIPGEIYVGGAGVTQGYLNRTELTQEKFVWLDGQRFYRTGDLGRWGADGNLEFLGRADFQIKLRGIRIELGDIEATLRQAPGVRDGVVAAHDLGSGEPSLVAYIVLAQNWPNHAAHSEAIATIRHFLSTQLPDYMVPTAFMVLEALPLNHNQKVDRRALPVPGPEILIHNQAIAPPATDLEARLVQIWETVLGLQPIGVHHNFFELGGNSLLAVQMLTQIEQELGKTLLITSLLRSPTIRSFAALLNQGASEQDEIGLIPLRVGGDRPPIFCIYGILLYKELADQLPADQPVYGVYLQEEVDMLTQGTAALENSDFNTVPTIAKRYLDVIRTRQPHGPYYLIGESFGGVVAYEMAQQLQADGEYVALVGLLDSNVPNHAASKSLLRRLKGHSKLLLKRGPVYFRAKMANNLSRFKAQGKMLAKQTASSLWQRAQKHWQKVAQPNLKRGDGGDARADFREDVSLDYIPQPYTGRLVLFRAMERDPFEVEANLLPYDLGWAPLAVNGLEIIEVPGDHLGILMTPNVQVTAAKLQACLPGAIAEPPTLPTAKMLAPDCMDAADSKAHQSF